MMRYSILSLFLAWLNYYGYQTVMCYKIPQVKLELLENGFRVSIPHEFGIESVIFNIEINQQCPEIFDLITEHKGNLWISEQTANKLKTNDELLINVVTQHDYGLFARTDKVQISSNYEPTYQSVKESDHTIDACNMNTWDDYAPNTDGRSMSRAYFNKHLSKRLYKPNELLFEDNFDKLDTKVWSYDMFMYSNKIGDNSEEFTMFTNDKNNIAVKGGELLITPTLSKRRISDSFDISGCKAPTCYEDRAEMCSYKKQKDSHFMRPAPVDSARITTKDSFSFSYGRIEISARLPEGDWLIPYVMLAPDKMNCSMRKQIRIAYATSKDVKQSRIWGGPVVLTPTVNPSNQKIIFERTSHMNFYPNVPPNKYHNFTLIWTPTQIALYVDKYKYGCISNHHKYEESYHIVFGVSAGGSLEYQDSPYKPWSNGYNNASQIFYDSFKGCCSKGIKDLGDCIDAEPRKKWRKCSRPWGTQSTMAIEYVRVYAV
ncbi:gram-negative bacteria-binding protein 2-like isoform X2 [Eurosta solidaginis]|uniref:gram-negative bacteria-binding protein 2-like isoform X2 n=1 Tax=Eurosta solidaginis TaxID=178769 RepID=UPI0035314EEC